MKKYIVEISETAKQDLENIISYLRYNLKSRRQYVTIDPFQIVRTIIIDDRTPGNSLYEKRTQYFYINEFTNYKINYFYITIYGNIDYREKCYDTIAEKYKKINHIKIYRGLKNENEFIEFLKRRRENNAY